MGMMLTLKLVMINVNAERTAEIPAETIYVNVSYCILVEKKLLKIYD